MTPLRAVFFDAGNTLFHPYPSVGHVYARVARKYGGRFEPRWVEERFRKEWQRTSHARRKLDTRAEKERWFELVRRMFGPHFPQEKFRDYFEELHELFARPRVWRLYPDALPTLERLRKKGFRLGVVSNWDARLFDLCRGLGVTRRVDFVIASGVEGVSKPDAGIFRRALTLSGVAPEEALHVGDSLMEDYRGALRSGLNALLLCRQGPCPKGVKRVRSLQELVRPGFLALDK